MWSTGPKLPAVSPKSLSMAENISSLYSQLGRRILKVVLKRNGGDLVAAEEVLQNTFVAILKSFHTFHHKSSYFTWACKIALNKLSDYYRDQVNSRSGVVVPLFTQLNQILDPATSPEEQLAIRELRDHLNNCLNLLPAEYRQLLQFKYYQQLSSSEICLRLDLSPRSLEGKLYRARHKLAAVVARLYPSLPDSF